MKTAICYCSQHHGNTLQLIRAMTEGYGVDLIDVTTAGPVDLTGYDMIGFASGIYAFELHPKVLEFLKSHLPPGKKVFFAYTYGIAKGSGTKGITRAAGERGAKILGEFGCRGYVTYGPFKLLGGMGKGRPGREDLERAKKFFHSICAKAEM
ncbi:MAG TPA: flavodoxin [Candidatus Enterenecus merdae]|nr:flavodoxin [Candidatus Enterenecus merdae]